MYAGRTAARPKSETEWLWEAKMIVSIDIKQEMEVPDDHQFLILQFTGGLSARRLVEGWTLEPIPIEGAPHIIGAFKPEEFKAVTENLQVEPIFYEQRGFSSGVRHRFFRPWSPTAHAEQQTTRDHWSAIAGNIPASSEKEKNLARNIALGIRNVEIHVGRITDFYGGQLAGAIRKGKSHGTRFSMGSDDEISASVHDFYSAIGSLRDHMAALIATRNGMPRKRDDLTKLMQSMKDNEKSYTEGMIKVLLNGKHLAFQNGKWSTAGILDEIRSIRRKMVHGTPHGAHDDERWGRVVAALGGENLSVLLYEHCFVDDGGRKHELLKLVRRHYLFMMSLLREMAFASGYASDMPVIDESLILSIKIDEA